MLRTPIVVAALLGILPASSAQEPPSRALLLELTQQARVAGTVGSAVGADICARHLQAAGWKVEIDERVVMLSLPRRIEVEVFAQRDGEVLHRRLDRWDPDAIPPGDIPLCNAWSASGEVTAPVVDVGRGLRADFERLRAAGVDFAGTIALARYGGAYRGIKVDLAAQYGCAGVLLFAERAKTGEAWPAGPWMPGHEAERGSISPMGRTPGDPSTPGWPSPAPGEEVQRLSGAKLDAALPSIPCTPIGWTEAEAILAHLSPRTTTAADGTAVEMPIGPGPAVVRMLVDMPRELRTIQNVIATLPGESADFVVAGAHRDAWVRGAHDNGTGVVAMIRAAQRLGALVEMGWKPKSTIVIGLWDGEEFGLIGSTEWAEANADRIRERCFAYVNCDAAVSGTHFRGASGTPGMLRVLRAALERVPTPEPRADGAPANLWEDWNANLKDGAVPEIRPAGSGSDFAVFLHHLSKPVIDVGLGGNRGGQYHTGFDDFAIVERYLDPGFVGHEMCGLMVAEILTELSYQGSAKAFDAREAVASMAQMARRVGGARIGGQAEPWLGAERAERIAGAFEQMSSPAFMDDYAELELPSPATRVIFDPDRMLPRRLYEKLALEGGIPGRSWYCNPIWTPGLEDGYGSEYFPILFAESRRGTEHLDLAVEELVEQIRACARGVGTKPLPGAPASGPK